MVLETIVTEETRTGAGLVVEIGEIESVADQRREDEADHGIEEANGSHLSSVDNLQPESWWHNHTSLFNLMFLSLQSKNNSRQFLLIFTLYCYSY